MMKEMKNGSIIVITLAQGMMLVSFLLLALLPAEMALAQYPVGLQALEQVENWPLYREGAMAGQVSSSDPLGDDADGTGYLYQQDSLYVIFDQEGPGCVYRLWIRNVTGASSRTLKFFFDGEATPRINRTVAQFFSGLQYPYLSPLTGNASVSSGGNYCYFPFKFAQHLKIAIVGANLPHQITYHLYPAGTPVTSYTGSEDPSLVVSQWNSTGSDPKDPTGNITNSGAAVLPPTQTQTIFSRTGGGSVTGIHITPSPTSLSVLESVRIRCYWDGSLLPQVDCTLGSFFGSSLGQAVVDGLPVGISGNEFYCYFPMPFWSNARIDLYNPLITISVNVSYEITYKTNLYPQQSGYFSIAQKSYQNSEAGQDIAFGELHGHGNLAGMVVTLISTQSTDFLHGDLRLYQDGITAPLMLGTDFDGDFNAGNYFTTGSFSLPVHGAPVVQGGAQYKVCAYRFFLGDLIPFGSKISLQAEHGNQNTVVLQYCSVVYSYKRPELALVSSDELDVGNLADEAAHNYSVQGGQAQQTHYYAYPGFYDEQFFTDQGRTIFGTSSFTAGVDPENVGIRLVRRRDASVFPQSALVSVNGDSVGIWWDSDYNFYKRWGDAVFEIPDSFTQGQSQVNLSFSFREGDGWGEYHYQVYSHVPPWEDMTPPTQVSDLSVQSQEGGTQLFLEWAEAYDEGGVAVYQIFRDDSPNVQPTSEFLVGEVSLEVFTDTRLTPGTWYYYKVRALDFSGNAGSASNEASQRTSSNYWYEGEEFGSFVSSSGDPSQVQNMIAYGENWSNQEQLFYASDETGDYFSVNLQTALGDSFDVAAYFTKGPEYGIVSVSVDGQGIGLPYDLYSPLTVRSSQVEFGTIYLTAGTHRFKFSVAGKNTASTNYRLGVDNLVLTSHYLLPVPPGGDNPSPDEFHLGQNHPNPFNSSTMLRFNLPQSGKTILEIFDLTGRKVVSLQEGWLPAGAYTRVWHAEHASSGIYFAVLTLEQGSLTRKLLLLK